ncbi:MAG: LanC-like protein [Actinobacteria bacterium]|nr:LanC-like protein [Actinomycetota bacterium]
MSVYLRRMLFAPTNHEPLTDEPWHEKRVRERISALVADADATFDDDDLWAPVEDWDTGGGSAPLPMTTLYRGASGVCWTLDILRARGLGETRLDLPAVAVRSYEIWRANPAPERLDPPVSTHASLFDGDSGILLVACKLAPSAEHADALHARVRENWSCETNELMNGSPGTILAAKAMLDWTGEERWAEAWRESTEELWRRRYWDGFWTYPPYGKSPGASHGIGTNTNVLLQGGDLLAAERREQLTTDTPAALAKIAVREDGLANWAMSVEDCGELDWEGGIRLQWCHGGAGVVAATAPYLDEELLLAGAELVWRAGPGSMTKGPGICHGTAGNGYALLRTFGRTGDELWLQRARRFAVHALGQVDRSREQRGRGRYTLWTGDLGAALFAADCLEARAEVPIVDYL